MIRGVKGTKKNPVRGYRWDAEKLMGPSMMGHPRKRVNSHAAGGRFAPPAQACKNPKAHACTGTLLHLLRSEGGSIH